MTEFMRVNGLYADDAVGRFARTQYVNVYTTYGRGEHYCEARMDSLPEEVLDDPEDYFLEPVTEDGQPIKLRAALDQGLALLPLAGDDEAMKVFLSVVVPDDDGGLLGEFFGDSPILSARSCLRLAVLAYRESHATLFDLAAYMSALDSSRLYTDMIAAGYAEQCRSHFQIAEAEKAEKIIEVLSTILNRFCFDPGGAIND